MTSRLRQGQVVQSGAKNIEVAVMERGKNVRVRNAHSRP